MNEQKNNIRRQIDRYISGELTPDEIDQLWADLLEFPELLEELKAEATLKSILADQNNNLADEPGQSYRTGRFTPYYRWALPLAAMLLLVIGISWFTSNDEPYPEAIQTISYAEMYVPDVQRSDEGKRLTGTDSLLHSGYNAAVNEHISEAISYFIEASEKGLDSDSEAEVNLNMGILFYNDRDFEQAAHLFKTSAEQTSSTRLQAKNYWFLANTYLQLEEFNLAYEYAQKAHQAGGEFAGDAGRLLQSLSGFAEASTQ